MFIGISTTRYLNCRGICQRYVSRFIKAEISRSVLIYVVTGRIIVYSNRLAQPAGRAMITFAGQRTQKKRLFRLLETLGLRRYVLAVKGEPLCCGLCSRDRILARYRCLYVVAAIVGVARRIQSEIIQLLINMICIERHDRHIDSNCGILCDDETSG